MFIAFDLSNVFVSCVAVPYLVIYVSSLLFIIFIVFVEFVLAVILVESGCLFIESVMLVVDSSNVVYVVVFVCSVGSSDVFSLVVD